MAQIPQLTHQPEWYKLISGALLNSNGRYESLAAFFRDEFPADTFPAKWKELFGVAEENRTGEYTQLIGSNPVPVMATYVAYDAEGHLISNEGVTLNKDTMPRMKIATNFNEKSVREGQFLAARGGVPEWERIFGNFYKDAAALIAGVETQRSYTALQIESTGKYVSTEKNNNGGLISLTFDFLKGAPASNRMAAGGFGKQGTKHAWNHDEANPIGDLMDMYNYYTDVLRVPYKGVFRMSKSTFNSLRNHPSTIKAVALWKTNGTIAADNLANYLVTVKDINEYLTERLELPAISVEDWVGVSQVVDPKTQKVKRVPLAGFADNTVVLRPEGQIGQLQWQAPTTMFSTDANPLYLADGGKIGVQQEIFSARKAMHFTAEFTGIPVPENIDYFLYLDTSKAA